MTQVPLLLHDSTSAHKSHIGHAAVFECGLEEMCHPPYYTDQTPNDYYPLPNLKKHFRGHKLSTDDELKMQPTSG